MDLAQRLLGNHHDGGIIYSLSPREAMLGFPPGNVSSYYSSNVNQADIEACGKAMITANISPYNTRLFKNADLNGFELRLAAGEHKLGDRLTTESGLPIQIVIGDYNNQLSHVVRCLQHALPFAANDHQRHMIIEYVNSFQTGSIEAHKRSQLHWVRDQGPVVETNLGFIESYRDPAGVRGEWEGFVSVVHKENSAKLGELVTRAPSLLPLLPWPRTFEKDEFKRPDFTSLEVIAFAGSGIPAGINIPNYDDIRQDHGFKNVSLGNVLTAKAPGSVVTFLSQEDAALYSRLKGPSFEVQVGGHELLGHGSGKVFCRDADGKFNFDPNNVTNPLTSEPITSWYEAGETYDTVFGSMGSAYEECRAECVGLYLSVFPEVLEIFGFTGPEAEDVMYVNWLNMVRAGLCALEFYSPEVKKWRQAHMQARFGILRVLLAAGQGLVELKILQEESKLGKDAIVTLDRSKILSVGVPALKDFLAKIQIYKTTADLKSAQTLFSVTDVPDEFVSLREVVLAKKQPRLSFVQANLVLDEVSQEVRFVHHPASYAGVVESFLTRFGSLY
jgi:dipeptidyl-peptidase-3